MDLSVVSWAFNGLLGVAMYLLRQHNEAIKEQLKENKMEIESLKKDKMDKLDFKEFKEELWSRFDKLEDEVRRSR